jgi:hypothetical protein
MLTGIYPLGEEPVNGVSNETVWIAVNDERLDDESDYDLHRV